MLATTEDLQVSVRPDHQRRSYSDSFKPKVTPPKHNPAPKVKKALKQAACLDSADEIQVIDDQQAAIPIRAGADHRQSDRHSDLDIGSVHLRKRRSSPLFERRKRDDLDLLGDFSESSDDDEDDYNGAHDQDRRGRGRRTKPLQHSRQTSPSQEQQHYDYAAVGRGTYSPQLGHHPTRGCSPHGRHTWAQLNGDIGKDVDRPSVKDFKNTRRSPRMPPAFPSGLEHEALVFDNFEDVSPCSSISEQEHEQESYDPFDAHLHFVRPAMPICTNAGAFAALEPFATPASSPRDSLHESRDAEGASGTLKRYRLGHHRTVSDVLSPTSFASTMDARSIRRRATVGSEAAYRLPTFDRRAS
ncbi:hypothetical protein PSEUBRA_004865 [Kalmanozyma brasiliensis GHG001]|uniref:Uncharacterized protein n=1 Tax=Kalmanozyma brasiliensis (strain GHG001) TaxID=1365824 RepID=V5EUL4_KALBG|nr:uncharacterized protein PSEUBRA_004865 [Kalmanozyma brasiliensis GHG001]EST05829.1 hypothetical protein PSEUBRA_004865 [Kalmanozyma brasiliensis GHG001]